MKKKNFILTVLVCFCLSLVFCLESCSDPKAEAEIENLKSQNAARATKIQKLRDNLDSLSSVNDSMYKSLENLDMVP